MANNNLQSMNKSKWISSSMNDIQADTDDDAEEINHYVDLANWKIANSNENIFDRWKDNDIQLNVEEQDVLLEKLSQLSTTQIQSSPTNKKIQSNDDDISISLSKHYSSILDEDDNDNDDDDENEIPTYLSLTNKSFTQMIEQISSTFSSMNPMNIEQLQEIAILIYQSAIIELKKSLWLTYFKAGTGTLNIEQPGPEIWLPTLKSLIVSSKKYELNKHRDDFDDLCFKLVNTRLHRFDHKQQQYQDQLDEKTKSIYHYQTIIAPILQTYIKDNLQSLQIEYENNIQLIIYDYEYHRIELEFLTHEPNEYQLELFQCLSHRKYKHVKAKQEVILLKEQLKQYKLPDSFNSIQLLLPSLIQTLDDPNTCQYLYDQHQKLLEKYQNDMMNILIKTAEEYMFQTQKSFVDEMNTMWKNQNDPSFHQKFNSVMLDLIDQRLINITEKVQCLYNYKIYH